MTSGTSTSVLRQFRTLYEAGTVAGMTDGQLLERFFEGRGDEAELAFGAILARHGAMVLGVCRRALRDPHEADDAFQATFLILVRKGRSVRVDDSLGRWLYGVSRKVAARARGQADRRRGPGLEAASALAGSGGRAEAEARDLRGLLDDELARLAEPFRSAVVLCDLGGLSLEEAARDLRCPVGTIKSRLARGRERLRVRLTRQGLAPSAAIVAAGPATPAALAEATARGIARFAASGKFEAGMVPASALALAEGILKSMTVLKLKLTAAAALTCGLAATGAGVLARQVEGAPAKTAVESKPAVAAAVAPKGPIERKLDEPMAIEFRDQPLGQAIADLQKSAGLNLVLDPRALMNLGVNRDTAKVNLSARGVRLRDILGSILDPFGLTFRVDADIVLITTPPDASPPGATAKGEVNADRGRALFWDGAVREIELHEAKIAELKQALAGRKADPGDPKPPAREFTKVSMPDYVVEPPDILVVEVLEALQGRPISGERLVRPDGKISLGFYGEVYVAGLTTNEAKAKVVQHLRQYLKDDMLGLTEKDEATGQERRVGPGMTARVFVDVAAYNSKVYYVQGEVKSPSRLPVTGNETVLDAINFAGGLTAEAELIGLIRPARPGEPGDLVLPVDLKAIIEGGDAKTNYQMLPGDRLVVARKPEPKPAPALDPETRLRAVERKLDLILKKLEIPEAGK